MASAKRPPPAVRVSARLRSALLLHAQGHAFNNEHGFTDVQLVEQMCSHTCRSLATVKGMGDTTARELLTAMAKLGFKLACGCPCNGERKVSSGWLKREGT